MRLFKCVTDLVWVQVLLYRGVLCVVVVVYIGDVFSEKYLDDVQVFQAQGSNFKPLKQQHIEYD